MCIPDVSQFSCPHPLKRTIFLQLKASTPGPAGGKSRLVQSMSTLLLINQLWSFLLKQEFFTCKKSYRFKSISSRCLPRQFHWQNYWNTSSMPPASWWRRGSSPENVSWLLSSLSCSFPGCWYCISPDRQRMLTRVLTSTPLLTVLCYIYPMIKMKWMLTNHRRLLPGQVLWWDTGCPLTPIVCLAISINSIERQWQNVNRSILSPCSDC